MNFAICLLILDAVTVAIIAGAVFELRRGLRRSEIRGTLCKKEE